MRRDWPVVTYSILSLLSLGCLIVWLTQAPDHKRSALYFVVLDPADMGPELANPALADPALDNNRDRVIAAWIKIAEIVRKQPETFTPGTQKQLVDWLHESRDLFTLDGAARHESAEMYGEIDRITRGIVASLDRAALEELLRQASLPKELAINLSLWQIAERALLGEKPGTNAPVAPPAGQDLIAEL